MRGKPKALPLTVSTLQRDILEKECRKVKISGSFKERVSIIVAGIQGVSISQTARNLGVVPNTVRKWRRRWEASQEELLAFEEDNSSGRLKNHLILRKIKEILSDLYRSGTPKRITLAQEQQIVSLACEKPEDHGIEMDYWTREMLAHVAKAMKIVDSISPRYVGTILKKTNYGRISQIIGYTPILMIGNYFENKLSSFVP